MRLPRLDWTHLSLCLFSASMTVGIGIFLPFFPVWLAAQGFGQRGVAFIVAIPALVRLFVNPPVAAYADRHGAVAQVLALCAAGSVGAYVLLGQAHGFWPILAGVCAVAASQGPILSLADTLIFGHIRQRNTDGTRPGLEYGSIRAWGSASVLAGMVLGGQLIGALEPQSILALLTLAAAITTTGAMAMARTNPRQPQTAFAAPSPARLANAPVIAAIIAAAALVQASHAVNYTFSSLDWRTQGMSPGFIGMAWAAGVFAEVLFFLFAGRRFGGSDRRAFLCLALGALAACLRWTAMMATPSAPWLILLQMTHGLSFGATHLGAVSLLARLVQPHLRARAQAWLASAISLALFVATVFSGAAHQAFGAASYGFMALVAMSGLALAGFAGSLQGIARQT